MRINKFICIVVLSINNAAESGSYEGVQPAIVRLMNT
jgi:hypothetical protein